VVSIAHAEILDIGDRNTKVCWVLHNAKSSTTNGPSQQVQASGVTMLLQFDRQPDKQCARDHRINSD
jgi:hypothetical protein